MFVFINRNAILISVVGILIAALLTIAAQYFPNVESELKLAGFLSFLFISFGALVVVTVFSIKRMHIDLAGKRNDR